MMDDDIPAPKIMGIFSEREKSGPPTIGTVFWFAREDEDGTMAVRPLDDNFMPAGEVEHFEREAFLKRFFLEPELWYRHVSQRLAQGDYYRKKNLHIEAKIEYNKVLAIDEENVRANFGLGLTYLAMNELEKASYVFETIVSLDEAFTPVHKHLFNEFGIAMRKKGMFEMALRYYGRAIGVAPDDENIFVNVARACHEKGDVEAALDALRKALQLNPAHREAGAFLDYLFKHGVMPKDQALREFFAAVRGPARKTGAARADRALPQEPRSASEAESPSEAASRSKASPPSRD
ncbi:Tetratricopeptide TPR_2 repeat-containing protein [Desulfovibrio sp. X2]|nr:Tetratricopeptide TPR_2 repeat-containing protein [Desulfovibrio sp. X2]